MMSRQAIPYGKKSYQYPISQTMPLDIVGSTEFGRYPKISSEQTFNMIISDNCLISFDGYKAVASITQGGVGREIYTSSRYNYMVAVVDNGVYTISTALSVSKIGTLDTSAGNVFISENLGGQIAITDGLNVYIFDYINGGFTKVVVDFLPGYITFQDTYFICADLKTNQWRLSGDNDGTSWPPDASHIGELQTKATNTVACVTLDRQLFVFGKTVCEPWYDVGYTLFPYQRTNYFSIDYGCLSPETISSAFGKLVWLGSNEKSGVSLMYTQGGQPIRISNDGLDYVFNNLNAPEDSFGFLFRSNGHVFYQLTFKTDNLTFLFDFETNKFFTLTDHKLDHHIAKRITFFNNKYYFISFDDAKLYQMSPLFTDYDGKEIPRFRICKNIRLPSGDKFIINNINITMESGYSKLPQVIDLSISRDGGASYQNIVRNTLNPLGARKNIVNFYGLGMANDAVIKFGFWGFQRFVVIGSEVRLYQ